MSTVSAFIGLVTAHGSPVLVHRDRSVVPCPCLTPEGYRDLEWHEAHPSEPVCNAQGMLPSAATVDISVKAFIQPAQSTRLTRLSDEYLQQVFGEIQSDDHVGIFPCTWSGQTLDFYDWSQAPDTEYVSYNNRRFNVVNANLIPDPSDGNPFHHWEVALRLIT